VADDPPPPFDWQQPRPIAEPPDPEPAGPSRRHVLVAGGVGLGLLAAGGVVAWVGRDEDDPRPDGAWTLRPYTGLGAWVDAYDWSRALGGPNPAVGPNGVEAMAAAGAQTLFLQTAHSRVDEDVLEPTRLQELIDGAHEAGLHVVAWYLPGFTDPAEDLRRLEASAALDVDGLAVDLEAVSEEDVALRTTRMVELGTALREHVGEEKVLGAITLSTIHLQVVNPAYWPGYPYGELADVYDVVLPMAYWTQRKPDLRHGDLYSAQEIQRLRTAVGADIPVHLIGGLAEDASVADVQAMVATITEAGAIGGGLYDWATSTPQQWAALAPLQSLRTD
jgi:hypothetical protein